MKVRAVLIGAVVGCCWSAAVVLAGEGGGLSVLGQGESLYQRHCAASHGRDGLPTPRRADCCRQGYGQFSDPVAMARVDDGRMYLAITKGRPGTAMSSWEHALAPAEVIDVMRYIGTLERPRPPDMSQLDLDLTVGGQICARHCVECHGSAGSGRTALTEGLGQFPRDFGDAGAMRSVSDDALRQTIIRGRPGTAMAPWRGILNEEDIRRVILYIRRTLQRQS